MSTPSPPGDPWVSLGSLLPLSFADEVSQGVWSGFIHFIGSQGSFHCGPVTSILSMVIVPLPRREEVALPPGWEFQTGRLQPPTSPVPQSGLPIHQLLWFPLTPASRPYESPRAAGTNSHKLRGLITTEMQSLTVLEVRCLELMCSQGPCALQRLSGKYPSSAHQALVFARVPWLVATSLQLCLFSHGLPLCLFIFCLLGGICHWI